MDRISSLPDELLTHILSFLKTKEAVQTCIISKRWRHAWAFLPVLKFYIEDWVDHHILDDMEIDDEEHLKEGEVKFKKYLNGVMENRKPIQLNKVKYQNDIVERSSVSLEFLARVLLQKPRVLSARVNWLDIRDLIFSCTSLEKLTLYLYNLYPKFVVPRAIQLPSLKVLKLRGINVDMDDDFIKNIFLGCPVLETLILHVSESEISEISSDVLKKLSFEFNGSTQIHICCPNLVSLTISSYGEIPSLQLENMPFREYADICFDMYDINYENILSSLSNVSNLCLGLCEYGFKVAFVKNTSRGRRFNNLKNLEFQEWDLNCDMNLLAYFLEHSPRLEEISFSLDIRQDVMEVEPSQEELRTVQFHREYLETVKIERTHKACDVAINQLIKFLHAHVKIIRNIIFI